MTHQPKWRGPGGAALSAVHPFTALGGFFVPADIAVHGAPGDKIDTVVATTLREGGPAYSGTAPRETAVSRATGAHNHHDCSTLTSSAPGVRVADA